MVMQMQNWSHVITGTTTISFACHLLPCLLSACQMSKFMGHCRSICNNSWSMQGLSAGIPQIQRGNVISALYYHHIHVQLRAV